jgi:hypothetical protein
MIILGLSLLVTFTLIISTFFFYQKKTLNFIQNSIVFIMFTIVTTNYLTILSLNLKWIKITESKFLFIGFILYRDALIPLLLLIFINVFFNTTYLKRKIIYFITFIACLQGLELICHFIGVIEYVKWSYLKASIANCAYLIISLILAKIAMFVKHKESLHDKSL